MSQIAKFFLLVVAPILAMLLALLGVETLPAIRFVRQHTLKRGDDVCDFQYCHVKQP